MTKDLISAIEERNVVSEIEHRKLTSAIDVKMADANTPRVSQTRKTKLFQKMPSLKTAFIMTEIFKKFGE